MWRYVPYGGAPYGREGCWRVERLARVVSRQHLEVKEARRREVRRWHFEDLEARRI